MPTTKTATLPEKVMSRKDEITAGFFELMEQHIEDLVSGKATKRFSAADFGQLLFIHPRHLTTTIKLTTGRSTCDFMEERIVLEANKLMADPLLSIAQVSTRLGYTEPTNFTKFYKSMTGITPREYRKSLV